MEKKSHCVFNEVAALPWNTSRMMRTLFEEQSPPDCQEAEQKNSAIHANGRTEELRVEE